MTAPQGPPPLDGLLALAAPEQVVERNPQATLPAARAVLDALAVALNYLAAGAPDEAIVSLNRPLMTFEPVADLLGWFSPEVVNDALVQAAHGRLEPLVLALDAMGLWAETGEAFADMQRLRGTR